MIPAIWTGMYASLPLAGALRKLNSHGWRAFEVSTEHFCLLESSDDVNREIEETLNTISDLKLYAPQGHGFLQADVAQPDKQKRFQDIKTLQLHIAIAANLGLRVLVIHPGGRGYSTRDEKKRITERNVESFQALGDLAGEKGIKIAIENMPRRGASSADEMLDLLDAIDHPAVGFAFDTSHANLSKVHLPRMLRAMLPHLLATHISDNTGDGDDHRTPGYGNIDWLALMQVLAESDYEGLLNLEIPGERHIDPDIRSMKSRQALESCNLLLRMCEEAQLETQGVS